MLYTSIAIIVFLILVYILSVRYKDKILINNPDKKEHKLLFLYPMAAFLLNKTVLSKVLNKPETVSKIRALYVSDQENNHASFYLYKKISLAISVVFVFSCLSLIVSVRHVLDNTGTFDGVLVRPETAKKDDRIRLKFRLEDEVGGKVVYEDEIVISNYARSLSNEEWEQALEEAVPYLELKMLGENKSLDFVYSNLNFIGKIPKTGITVEWIPEDHRLISSDGTVNNKDLTEKKNTCVTAVLKHRDKSAQHTIPLTVWPYVTDEKDKLYQKLEKIIADTQEQTGYEREWILPERMDEYIIKWDKSVTGHAGSILVLGLSAAVLIWYLSDRELENKIRQRNNQMMQDYPEIINKFSLLVNAGMTVKQAWSNISEDYKRKKDCKKGGIRYAYEEMMLTLNELKLGIPESQAYEQFGQRTGLLPYMKFSSLLVQNLKKGNKDMVNLLRTEAVEAFHERKEAAKRLGEEASTKLIVPMAIMLFIVLVIIMIPALLSFSI